MYKMFKKSLITYLINLKSFKTTQLFDVSMNVLWRLYGITYRLVYLDGSIIYFIFTVIWKMYVLAVSMTK
jgi:hypothetical protein